MSDEMVERVARAIEAIDCHKDYRGMLMADKEGKWSVSPEFAGVLARAALGALREPSEEMLEAMRPWTQTPGHPGLVWRAGIDSALGRKGGE